MLFGLSEAKLKDHRPTEAFEISGFQYFYIDRSKAVLLLWFV